MSSDKIIIELDVVLHQRDYIEPFEGLFGCQCQDGGQDAMDIFTGAQYDLAYVFSNLILGQ